MRAFLTRSVAIAALALAPVAAMAQGGPNPGNGPGNGPRGEAPRAGQQGGMRGEGGDRQGGEGGMRGEGGGRQGGGNRAEAPGQREGGAMQRGDNGMRGDGDRGDKGMRGDRGDRGEMRGDRDNGRMERRDAGANDGRGDDRRNGEMRRGADDRGGRVGERGEERGARRGPVRTVTTEQRTRIRNVFRSRGIDRLGNVDFAVRVGTAVPARYNFRPLPPEILEFVPEYEGYDYIAVGDQILILDPVTRDIVAIIS